MYNQKHTV